MTPRRRHRRRPQGRDGRAVALPRLHQPVPDAAAPVRRPALTASGPKRQRPGLIAGAFSFVSCDGGYAASAVRIRPATPGRHSRHHPHLCAMRSPRHRLVRARAADEAEMTRRHARTARRRLSVSGRRDSTARRRLCLCRRLPRPPGLPLHRGGLDLCRAGRAAAAASAARCSIALIAESTRRAAFA